MTREEILAHADHTVLSPVAVWADIQAACDDSIGYKTASVCIPPAYVARAREYVGSRIKITTVIGFPNGYMTTAAKIAEAEDALANGTDELDMVINLGDVKNGDFAAVEREIGELSKVCGSKLLKVIVEACLLTEDEKLRMCKVVTNAGADFIKTSTGFASGGATLADVRLFREQVGPNVQVKAAGGIRTFEDAEEFINAGAARLGTSALIGIVKSGAAGGAY